MKARVKGTVRFTPVAFRVHNANRFDERMGEWIPAWNAHHVAENGGTLSCLHGHPTLHQARLCGKRSVGKVIEVTV